jgi:hypothetical protein
MAGFLSHTPFIFIGPSFNEATKKEKKKKLKAALGPYL